MQFLLGGDIFKYLNFSMFSRCLLPVIMLWLYVYSAVFWQDTYVHLVLDRSY